MKVYKQIPRWWYFIVLVGAFAIAQASEFVLQPGRTFRSHRIISQLHRKVWIPVVDVGHLRHYFVHLLRRSRGPQLHYRLQPRPDWTVPDDYG